MLKVNEHVCKKLSVVVLPGQYERVTEKLL